MPAAWGHQNLRHQPKMYVYFYMLPALIELAGEQTGACTPHMQSADQPNLGEQMAVPSGRGLQTMPGEGRLCVPFNVSIQRL